MKMTQNNIKIIKTQNIGLDEIWLQIKVNDIMYSGCITEVKN